MKKQISGFVKDELSVGGDSWIDGWMKEAGG